MTYIEKILKRLLDKNPGEKEYHQAVIETLTSVEPLIMSERLYEDMAILERLIEPERVVTFRVSWRDDRNKIHVNRGYRVQFNSCLGPYKGGIRFHPSVNSGIIKFLAFEQTFKNALTGLPIGGGKGGSDFDPKGKSDFEIMTFCQNFMNEIFRHIGSQTDIPAGDIGVGEKEIGFLFGQYKKIKNIHEGVLTGKGITFDGLRGRKEATGYGLIYFTEEMLKVNNESFNGKTVCISGSGNVAIHAAKKAKEFGAKIVTMSDSSGWIYDSNGINLEVITKIKEEKRERIKKYLEFEPKAKYVSGRFDWSVSCNIALPCATQNEINEEDAKNLVKNGVKFVSEGANMPTTLDAIKFLTENGIVFGPAKAANAGGVSSSVIEMSQNSSRIPFDYNYSSKKLYTIMKIIFKEVYDTAQQFGDPKNYILGANISGFKRVAKAMISQGIV
ncbi:MAG: NADP-specific glutamate dehydrogenase [Firmicutes bacterium]|nr:NADP-specific glutamate dehydrogenase [Bacillota bacterium]